MLDSRRLLTFRKVPSSVRSPRAAEEPIARSPLSRADPLTRRRLEIRLIDRGPGGLGLTAAGALLCGTRMPSRAGCVWPPSSSASRGRGRRHLAIEAFPSAIATIVPKALVRMRPPSRTSRSASRGHAGGARRRRAQRYAPPRRPLPGRRRPLARPRELERTISSRSRWWRRCPRGTASRADGRSTSDGSRATPGSAVARRPRHRTCLAAGFGPNIAFVARHCSLSRRGSWRPG